MDILKRIIHDLNERKANADSKALPTPSCVREASATERAATYMPPNYGLLFCCHGKSYFDTCGACKRTRKMAREQYEHFCRKHGI